MQGIRFRRFETLQFETGMKPKPRPEASQLNLFQAQFDPRLNLEHPRCVLARKIDWTRLRLASPTAIAPIPMLLARTFACWSGCMISNTCSTNRTSHCWNAGCRMHTGSTSAGSQRSSTRCRCTSILFRRDPDEPIFPKFTKRRTWLMVKKGLGTRWNPLPE